MSRERSAKFREAYRARIVGWYNGYFHAFLVFATGLSVLYVCVQHIENVSWLEWLTVPLVFLLTNWFEWDLHKNFMHQQSSIKALQIIHRYHMLNHHQYFTDEDMHFHDHRDWRITIFPPYVITILILIAIPFAALVGWVFSPNVGWLFLSVVTSMVDDLRVHPPLLPLRGELVRQELPADQHRAPPSHRAPQSAHDDQRQHERDVSDRRLAVRHVGSQSRAARASVQRL